MTTSDERDEITAWVTARLPDGMFTAAPTVTVDREEIVVIGDVGEPELDSDAGASVKAAALAARIARFREESRAQRMRIADEAEHRFGRKVSWGAKAGERTELFTHLSVPVMTRLRQRERRLLDTLVDAGVARSRSDALGWCVRLVEANEGAWIDKLRESLVHVEKVRSEGPSA